MEDRDTVQNYTAGSEINQKLKGNTSLNHFDLAMVSKLDNLVKPVNLKEVHRVLHNDHPENQIFDSLKIGDNYSDSGFTSTTKSMRGVSKIISDMSEWGGEPSHLITFNLKHPVGIDVNLHLGKHPFSHQDEVILPRNKNFVKTNEFETNGIKHHILEEV